MRTCTKNGIVNSKELPTRCESIIQLVAFVLFCAGLIYMGLM